MYICIRGDDALLAFKPVCNLTKPNKYRLLYECYRYM